MPDFRSKFRLKVSRRVVEAFYFYLFISPWALGFLVFSLGAMVFSLAMSFTEWDMLRSSHFVGLGNYMELFKDRRYLHSLRVTAFYTFGSVPLSLISGLAVAMLLNQKIKGMTIFRTMFYLPSLVSGVAAALLWTWIFNPEFGLLNWILALVGIQGPGWVFDPDWALPSLILMNLWGIGGGMVIYLAGLQGIPTALYEAAEIDGAGAWHRFRFVTIPMMTPVIFFNAIMGIIGSFQVFTSALIMTSGGPADATLFNVLYIYQQGFQAFHMGYASAIGWILFIVILGFTFLIFKSSAAWVYYAGELKGR